MNGLSESIVLMELWQDTVANNRGEFLGLLTHDVALSSTADWMVD